MAAPEFAVPALTQSIRDLELASSEEGRLRLQTVVDVEDISASEQSSLAKNLLKELDACNDPSELVKENSDWLNRFYSLVRFFEALNGSAKLSLLDAARGLLDKASYAILSFDANNEDEEVVTALRSAFKCSTYFVAKICVEEEKRFVQEASVSVGGKAKSKSKSSDSEYLWPDQREFLLRSLVLSIRPRGSSHRDEKLEYTDFGKLWKCALPEEAYLDLLWRTAESMVLENSKLVNASDSKDLLEALICIPVNHFHETISHLVSASFAHSLRKHDSMPDFITNVLQRLVTEYNDIKLAREVILEIGRIDTQEAARESTGVKLLGTFIENLAKELPALVLSSLSVLVPHLSAQAYQLRCSIVKALGHLVAHLKSADEADANESQGEDDNRNSSKSDTKATRDNLLDLIGERSQDTSSYVRSSALASIHELVSTSCLPLSHIHIACDISCERLLDKSSIVRKQAISCLAALLENNPYSASLNPAFFRERITETAEKLKQVPKVSPKDATDSEQPQSPTQSTKHSEEGEEESTPEEEENAKSPVSDDNKQDEEDEEATRTVDPAVLAEFEYYKGALGFTSRMEHACEQAEQLVCSTSVTDVLESMRFLSAAFRFKLPAALGSIRKLLVLVWDDRESGRVKKELLETFELIFVSEPIQVGRSIKRKLYADEEVADNLIGLVLDATLSELTCLEAIIGELVANDGVLGRVVLPMVVIEKIWDVACSSKDESCSAQRIRAAMCLVAMTATSPRTLFERRPSYVTKLQTSVLGTTDDFGLARYGLMALGRVLERTPASLEQAEEIERIVAKLICCEPDLLAKHQENLLQWYPTTEQGLEVLVQTSARPDLACAALIRKTHKMVFAEELPLEADLARLLFLVGHVAVKLLVYSDVLGSKVKKQRRGKEEALERKRSKAEVEELTMLGANEDAGDDFEESVLRRISEQELVGEDSLLGSYVPLLSAIIERGLMSDKETLSSPGSEYTENQSSSEESHVVPPSRELMESAALALCKMCCISNSLCERYLRLLLTVLRDSQDPNVRSNIMIALGDLAVRFPNTIEPFTSQVYRRLRDPDVGVRKTSLMCLSHLILNDMLKVRGEISEILVCVEDEESLRIRDLACLFFHEMSRKGTHPIYNLLVDTVGKLSRDPTVDESKFKKLAKFLMQFIVLDKHVVSITEKLCQRIFAGTGLTTGAEEVESVAAVKEIKMCRDMAYCLSELKLSDRALAKLVDDAQFKLYKPVLADEAVHECFISILKKARQFSKPETKQLLDDWVEQIDAVREVHLSNHATTNKAKKASKARQKKTAVTQKKKSVTRRAPSTRVSRQTNKENRAKQLNSSDEEEEVSLASDYSSA
eukprot:CAMPEP_0184551660 /NCGR_PEP_ID=MMETSP0199_2-20130426/26089_1 /TAXON_ID=1112570 /ORGANISM="Thraustochytrium sp., Strain LLF1b" /LENGTH=1348 /DNA_ID=CAMNT_0026946923 /DNA_START=146 /DNA_END=4192 /DNA_ORIENTATION=+